MVDIIFINMTKQELKEIIRECLIEEKRITQKDINAVHPKSANVDDMSKLSLSNLKALRDKAARTHDYEVKQPEPDTKRIKSAIELVKKYNGEIKKRLKYVNKPV